MITSMSQYLGQFRGDNTPDEDEYEQYLERFAEYRTGTPLTFERFQHYARRWEAEYDAAWEAWGKYGVPATAKELEYWLVV